ncbi:MAG: methionyl-tRNA formyltransferase [Hydrogenophilus sp.]|nr:methionyl-tRNA formyltransferase [Hydrogenophilus sp.]
MIRRVAFAGTPTFAARTLKALLQSGVEVVGVLTQPDRPAGRGLRIAVSPVKALAIEAGVAVAQPASLRDPAAIAALEDWPRPDALVVAAYGLILPQAVLSWPRLGCVNVHASLLPRWRGAAPIVRAIEAGDRESGVTLMAMDEGLDTGPILAQRRVMIAAEETGGSLHDRLAEVGAEMMVWALPQLEALLERAQPQQETEACYAPRVQRAERVIDWRDPAVAIERRLRAFDPVPGCETRWQGMPLKVWRGVVAEEREVRGEGVAGEVMAVQAERGVLVRCGEGGLWLTEVQRPGGRRMPIGDFLRGCSVKIGERLGD